MLNTTSEIPELDEMLHSLLLLEEGEHELGNLDEEIQELRQLFFPVTRHCTYLNHAGSGPLPLPVIRTLHDLIDDMSAYGSSSEPRWQVHIDGARRRLAQMIHARPDQIAFTASTGDGLHLIASGLDWQKGDRIILAEGEFPANVYPWLNLQEQGVEIYFVPMRDGRIPPEDVFAAINERTRLVSLSLVEFATGFRNDIAAIASYCHKHNILVGIDAMQALGALAIDVEQLGIDYLAAAAHKWLLSPHTTGILYVTDELLSRLQLRRRGWASVTNPMDFFNYEQPLKAGAIRFEHSSPNRFPIISLDAALGMFEGLEGGMQAVEGRILGLTTYLITGLEGLGYPIISPQGRGERSGIVCFAPHPERRDLKPQQITAKLAEEQIHIAARGTSIRVSPHFYNTEEDIDTLLNMLETLKRPESVQG